MPFKLLLLLFLFSAKAVAQPSASYDSLITEMCTTLKLNKSQEDTVKIQLLISRHLVPYLEKVEKTKAHKISNDIYVRAQRECKDFGELIFRLTPKNSDWEEVQEKPISKLNKISCRNFIKHKMYQYIESNGDTVNLTIDQGFWTDHFKDGSFSKLKFKWISDCEFQIEFVESNNEMRKNFSKPGDKYNYQVLEKGDNYYFMSAEIVGGNQFMTFKLYY